MADTDCAWWIDRFRVALQLVDFMRLDHFRGFAGDRAVPHGNTTAERAEWIPGPAAAFFEAIRHTLGPLPIIDEDLGVTTPDMDALRLEFDFPGMEILQFAFGSDPEDGALPHNFEQNTTVHMGTHDDDTTIGWWMSIGEDERQEVRNYFGTTGADISWDMMRLAFSSMAELAVVPVQDVVRAGTHSRMNLPAKPDGNWSWRFVRGAFTEAHLAGLEMLVKTYGRAASA